MSSEPNATAGPSNPTPPSKPRNGRDPPRLSIQAMVASPMAIQQTPSMDAPFRRCFSTRSFTPRSHLSTNGFTESICWRRLFPEVPQTNVFTGSLLASALGHKVTKSKIPDEQPLLPYYQEEEPVTTTPLAAEPKDVKTNQNELSLFRGKVIEYHRQYDGPPNVTMWVKFNACEDGSFKSMQLGGKNVTAFKETMLGYEALDAAGGYHFYVPVGLVPHRLYSTVARQVDYVYGPSMRFISKTSDRVQTSFASGKQSETWGLIWSKLRSAEGAKLWFQLCDQVRVISERAKEAENERKERTDKSDGKES